MKFNSEIKNYIITRLKSENPPLRSVLKEEVYEKFDYTLSYKLINNICKELQITCPVGSCNRLNIATESGKICSEADSNGITSTEIFVAKCKGFTYPTMCRLYFDLYEKVPDARYFAKKFLDYCTEHDIKLVNRNIHNNPDFSSLLERAESEIDFENASEFFRTLISNEKINSPTARHVSLEKLHDPHRKLRLEDGYEH